MAVRALSYQNLIMMARNDTGDDILADLARWVEQKIDCIDRIT